MTTQDSLNTATTLPPASAAGLSVGTIEMVANHFRKVVGDGSASDMHHLVGALKGKIKVVAPDERRLDIQGTLEVRSADDWTIYLAEQTGPLQDRFTLAHEIGHFVLHSKLGRTPLLAFRTFSSSEAPSIVEQEADAFALALLMPTDLVLEAIKVHGKDVSILSAEFGVTPAIAELRLSSPGLS